MNSARFLKYVWPFYKIMHERVKGLKKCCSEMHTIRKENNKNQKEYKFISRSLTFILP